MRPFETPKQIGDGFTGSSQVITQDPMEAARLRDHIAAERSEEENKVFGAGVIGAVQPESFKSTLRVGEDVQPAPIEEGNYGFTSDPRRQPAPRVLK